MHTILNFNLDSTEISSQRLTFFSFVSNAKFLDQNQALSRTPSIVEDKSNENTIRDLTNH